jgi:hypothetical protein
VRYSLWHNDTLIGHTELSYVTCVPRSRLGELIPTELGLELLIVNEHLEGLELQLRDESGGVIPTEHISTHDFTRPSPLGADDVEGLDFDEAALDDETRAAIEHDAALIQEWMADSEPDDLWKDYQDDVSWDDGRPFYQIVVQLYDDHAIPASSDLVVEDSP